MAKLGLYVVSHAGVDEKEGYHYIMPVTACSRTEAISRLSARVEREHPEGQSFNYHAIRIGDAEALAPYLPEGFFSRREESFWFK